MVRKTFPMLMLAAITAAAWGLAGSSQTARADSPPGAGDLFANYYVPAGATWGVPAQMYLSPRPTPPWVGWTYITYQPLMPHEFLYEHHRTYRRYNPGAGWTTTRVHWCN